MVPLFFNLHTLQLKSYVTFQKVSPKMSSASEVLNVALALKPDERAELAHKLLLSLEPDDLDQDADQAWADEIRRRLQAIRQGRAELRDWDDALSDIRQAIVSKGQA